MAFTDEYQFESKAGKGGDGVVRWRHEKSREFAGPAGGDGGRGGDVYIRAVRDIALLSKYRNKTRFDAEDGHPGEKKSMKGKNGEDLYIELPVGSVVTNLDTHEIFDLTHEGDTFMVLAGGQGGYGNENFKSSRNITPKQATTGKPGQEGRFAVELRLIADIGLIGLPSAGKSSLLNALTHADAKVGAYDFTTLEPNLGVMYGIVLADIPGLIEGASEGKGLGHKFLRHVRRTHILAHCVSCEHDDITSAYHTIREELKRYDETMCEKPEILILTKTDMCSPEELSEKIKEAKKLSQHVETVTLYDDESVKYIGGVFARLENEKLGI
ncbi:MAG: GTPase ObgE [Candidatus Yonathbacteria bacterium]|nr:GTPase ObgE [Candidatus Yonathbacteria bacterium]NTW47478.1 GTPase ObgE [Candidatus Yonathbacteria bacterium]